MKTECFLIDCAQSPYSYTELRTSQLHKHDEHDSYFVGADERTAAAAAAASSGLASGAGGARRCYVSCIDRRLRHVILALVSNSKCVRPTLLTVAIWYLHFETESLIRVNLGKQYGHGAWQNVLHSCDIASW